MKILILGANGILGHTLFLKLNSLSTIQVLGLVRKNYPTKFIQHHSTNLLEIDLLDFPKLEGIIKDFQPTYIINCAVVKSIDKDINSYINCININSLLPNKISQLTHIFNFKFIQISTDGVFGAYGKDKTEESELLIDNLYSASKSLGEPIDKNTMVIRTSFIGHSLKGNTGLLDWIISSDKIEGFVNQVFAGLTSLELSNLLIKIMLQWDFNSGIFHVTGTQISKYDLITKVVEIYNLNKPVNKITGRKIDRSLSSNKFYKLFCYHPPSWNNKLLELKNFYYTNKNLYE